MDSESIVEINDYDIIAKRTRDRERREQLQTSDTFVRSDFQETRYASNDSERIIKTYSTGTAAHLVNYGDVVELRLIEDPETDEKQPEPAAATATENPKELKINAKSMKPNPRSDPKYRNRAWVTASAGPRPSPRPPLNADGEEMAGKSRIKSQSSEERQKPGSSRPAQRTNYSRQQSETGDGKSKFSRSGADKTETSRKQS